MAYNLSDKAYSTYTLLQRFTVLMEGRDNAKDSEIEAVCREIADTLKEWRTE